MAQKIEVYGVPPGEKQDEWLLALYVNPKVVIGSTPGQGVHYWAYGEQRLPCQLNKEAGDPGARDALTCLGLFPIMRVLHSLWEQTKPFVTVTLIWLIALALFAGALLWILHELVGESSAYRNTFGGRVRVAIREFFLFGFGEIAIQPKVRDWAPVRLKAYSAVEP